MKYSVLTFNIGGYELMHNIEETAYNEMKDEVEFIYVTDNHSITSNTWTIVYADDLTGSTFDKVFQIRYNPFNYVHTDIVMKIDGSMGITKNLIPIFEYFENGNYDAAVMIHPTRNTMYPEYVAWVNQRGYPVDQANKCMNMFAINDYDAMNYKGLYQYNFMIQRNDSFNAAWNEMTYKIVKAMAPEGDTVDRLDQTIGSFVLNKFFYEKNVMPVGQYICDGLYFNWYAHNTENRMVCDDRNNIEPHLFNKSCYLACLY